MNIVRIIWLLVTLNLLTITSKAQTQISRIDTLDNFNIEFNRLENNTSGLLFLTGELHGVSSNPMSEFYSSQFFVKYHNTKTILLEAGYTDSYLLNNFFTNGDMDFLEIYLSDYPTKYVEIRDALLRTKYFYDSLPLANKFQFISVDIVENDDQPYGFNLLNLIADKSVKNPMLKSELIKLNYKDSFPNEIVEYESILSKYKPNTDFDSAIFAIFGSYKNWLKSKQNLFKNRQYYLYRNVLDKISTIKSGNFYGQFGYGHIDLKQKCMAYYLNNDPLFLHKVFSIYPFYYDCNSSFFELPRAKGYHRIQLNNLVKKLDLQKGIYLVKHKECYYHVHVGFKQMIEIKE